ncbi:MAG: nucleotidyl transferase AbiEii/AbiGii toxin family protein [candidate division Zixibacteria bacterium]|nr:nucleotidyl transferase AbiEii/AbiGii toxin family protein [candidate division Zixibacteria bacterium]
MGGGAGGELIVDFEAIRTLVIQALFSDDVLTEHLVLKGGNALDLVYHIIDRGSLDVDCSIEGEFDDVADIERRIFSALERTFQTHRVAIFDRAFSVVPPVHGTDPFPWWGGYVAEFKLIEQAKYAAHSSNLAKLQREALPIDASQLRTFRIDISKHEYCRDKVKREIAEQAIYVYSEEMCVFEKYRSLCQQMPQYQATMHRKGSPRGRDFYDIYATITRRGLDIALPENLELCREVFAAKRVPLELVAQLPTTREFHRPDWDAVLVTIEGDIAEFDFYFDFVVNEANKLKPLWDV